MARLVHEAVKEMEEKVVVKQVVTKTHEGAIRYQAIIKAQKYLVPIPSILINDQMAFTQIPGKEELIDFLKQLIGRQPQQERRE